VKAKKVLAAVGTTIHLGSLFGPRLGTISECSSKNEFDDDTIKKITGGDSIAHCGLYQGKRPDKATCKILIASLSDSNEIPKAVNTDSFNKRVCCIPCNAVFVEGLPKEHKDKTPEPLYPPSFSPVAVEGAVLFFEEIDKEGELKVPCCTKEYLGTNNHIGHFLGWLQDNGNRANQESEFDFLATRQCLVKIDEGTGLCMFYSVNGIDPRKA